MSRCVRIGFWLLVSVLVTGIALQAQNVAGSISGTVDDAQGAVVPGAKVTLTNQEQGAASARVANTNTEGVFVFTPVLAGTYTVEVEMNGFKRFVQSGIILRRERTIGPSAAGIASGRNRRIGDRGSRRRSA
ncbi:MAG TPA: carboxypeptidase-like regulatory domain-containing protein [Bryobacteraceae bacterium]